MDDTQGREKTLKKKKKKKLFREDEVSGGRRASGARGTGPTCSLALDHPVGAQPPRQQLGCRRPAARAGPSSIPGPGHTLRWPAPRALLALAAGGSRRGTAFLFASGPPCSTRPAAFHPARGPFDSRPLMLWRARRAPRQAAVRPAPLAERRGNRDRPERNSSHV